jgi:hypothetical protein
MTEAQKHAVSMAVHALVSAADDLKALVGDEAVILYLDQNWAHISGASDTVLDVMERILRRRLPARLAEVRHAHS